MNRIYARNCLIKEVEYQTAKLFLEINHDQGYTPSKIKYGLYYEGDLVQIMTFGKPRFNKAYQWEIIRECTKKGIRVIGGTSKLWKHFLANNSCINCICYSYPHDNIYTDHYVKYCGFNNVQKTAPSKREEWEGEYKEKYYSFSMQYLRMYGVDKILGTNYGKSNGTNTEILNKLGFKKVTKDYVKPQIDAYFPFELVYQITDQTTGEFYIGQCCNKESWNNGHLGSGTKWLRHLKKYPNHNYNRTILKDNFLTPTEIDKYEVKMVKKYGDYGPIHNNKKALRNPKCYNIKIAEQRNYNGSRNWKEDCPECGGKKGQHKKTCSQSNPCPECGQKGGKHKENRSKYHKKVKG